MVTAIRIGILGTHSTGKTVLMRRIEMELRALGIATARTGGLGKRAAELGLPKMHHHTEVSTEWILTAGIAAELQANVYADVVLADRAAPNALAYYTAALEHRGEMPELASVERLGLLVATQTPQYDLLLATVLDSSAPVQEKHDYNPQFRELVDRHVHQLLDEQRIAHFRVTNNDASRDEAVRLALDHAMTGVGQRMPPSPPAARNSQSPTASFGSVWLGWPIRDSEGDHW